MEKQKCDSKIDLLVQTRHEQKTFANGHKKFPFKGLNHELLIAKFRLKLKKVWKTTGPLRYDLNQIPYDYTVEVRNRFKGLDLIDRVPKKLWMDVRDVLQEVMIKIIHKKNQFKKAKWLSEEALQIAEKTRQAKSKMRKRKIYPFECAVPKNSNER